MSDSEKAPYIHLDTEKMRDIISAAVFQVMSAESKESLLKQALKNLIEPRRDSYSVYTRPSHLQEIFDSAVRRLAEEVVKEQFAKDEVKEEVRGLMLETFEKIFHDSDVRDKMTHSLCWAFRDGINKLASLSKEAIDDAKKAKEKRENG